MRQVDPNCSEEEARQIFLDADLDGNELVDIDEFIALMQRRSGLTFSSKNQEPLLDWHGHYPVHAAPPPPPAPPAAAATDMVPQVPALVQPMTSLAVDDSHNANMIYSSSSIHSSSSVVDVDADMPIDASPSQQHAAQRYQQEQQPSFPSKDSSVTMIGGSNTSAMSEGGTM